METSIQKINDVEFDLEITATAGDLADDIEKAVRAQRGKTQLKGFRPGNVPVSVVKRIYGKSLAYGVAEHLVQKTYEDTVMGDDTYHVLGQPTITDLTYEYEGDLRAVVRFGVRPEFELADISKETINKLKHEGTDEDLQKEIDHMRGSKAELVPAEGPSDTDSVITVDMQNLDPETNEPVDGEVQEGVQFALADENLMTEIVDKLTGTIAGDVVEINLPGRDEESQDRSFKVTVQEVKQRVLPDLDDELVKELTSEKFDNVDSFKDELQKQIKTGWEQRGREDYESDVVGRLIEIHDISVPESVVDMYLDSYVKELKEKQGDKLPTDFDEAPYRDHRREEAQNQARWMFIRDKIMDATGFEITEEDRDAYLEKTTGGEVPLETMKEYYRAVPNMMEQLDQRLLSERVFSWIESQVTVKELDLEAYREATKPEQA
jgi:trigger factor